MSSRNLLLTYVAVAATSLAQPAGDIPYVFTPPATVKAMLELAHVGPADTVVDLGSGDGRIVIAAAKDYGAHAIGVEIDPSLVRESRLKAERAGVAAKTEFVEGDLFRQDLHRASVVTLFLLPSVNLRLKPKLLKELAPGSRIVSHQFDMGEWRPVKSVEVGGEPIYLWIVPRPAAN